MLSEFVFFPMTLFLLLVAAPAESQSGDTGPMAERVDLLGQGGESSWNFSGYTGSFGYNMPLNFPAYFAITPRLSFSYVAGKDGTLGTDWALWGLVMVERFSKRKGVPTWDKGQACIDDPSCKDIFTLDGNELLSCKENPPKPNLHSRRNPRN